MSRSAKSPASAGPRKTVLEPEKVAPPLGVRLGLFVYRPRTLLLLALLVSSTVVVPLVRDQLPDLTQRNEYLFDPSKIEINEPPRWVPENLVEQVVRRANLPRQMSLLDDKAAMQVAEAFQQHPWVLEVQQVRKQLPARVIVELKYRRPVAMVRVKQGLYPVDAAGVLLPPTDFSLTEAQRYPTVDNVQSTPDGPAGTPWKDPAVGCAARLAEILAPHWKSLDLAQIRIPELTRAETREDDLTFELLTSGGSRIIWGRTPGTDHPGELPADQKIGRLKKYRSDFGSFDQPHGPYEIDIRHWQEISRRPISARPETSSRK